MINTLASALNAAKMAKLSATVNALMVQYRKASVGSVGMIDSTDALEPIIGTKINTRSDANAMTIG